MPGINSTTASRYESGWEMEYDHYQHYFYDDHDPDEDFSKSTAPSEDIWKKFELVPTPPMSPIRTLEGAAGVGMVCPSLGDKLEWVSQFLGQEDDQDVPCKLSSADEALGNLSSIIVQDCMWSGFSAGKQLEKVFGERLASCPNKLPMQAMGAAITTTGRAQCVTVPVDAAVPVLGSLATDCMDPAAVLAFPLTGGTFKKPSVSSWSGTHTDSSDDESSDHDDDDDDDDDDEEEIDVVTVEHKQYKSRRLVKSRVTGGRGGGLNRRTPVTIMVRADALNPCMKRFHISIHQQHHNYAAPSPDTHTAPALPGHTAPALPRKRVRHEPSNSSHNFSSTQPHLHPASTSNQNSESKPHVAVATIGSESSDANTPSPCGSPSASPRLSSCHPCSPQSSDYEDTDKRKTHNFLERKRRNDLRSRFLALRDEVPGLAECPKTPKVAILTRATEYLGQLHSSERQRAQEKRQLKARQQQLLRRLAQLKQRP